MAILEIGLYDGTHLELPWTFGEDPEKEEAAHLAAALFGDSVIYRRISPEPVIPSDPDSLNIDAAVAALIYRALIASGWVQKEAAEMLGITPRALGYNIRKYNIQPPAEVAGRWRWAR